MSVAYYKRKDGSEVRREKLFFFDSTYKGIQNKLTFEGKFLSKVNYHIV